MKIVNDLLKRISYLEFEVEKLEKNVQYKYINGQAYFRQDYVLGREKEIDRLNKINNEMYQWLLYQINEAKFYREYEKADILEWVRATFKELKGEYKE